jgi:hypothetical protein
VRDPNLRTGVFESYSGSTISEYQQNLALKVSQSANAGIEGLGSFSVEIGANFGQSRAQSDGLGAFCLGSVDGASPAWGIDYISNEINSYIKTTDTPLLELPSEEYIGVVQKSQFLNKFR